MFPDIHYQSNMLKQVIVRIDWLSEISEVRSELPKDISSNIRAKFPTLDPRQVFSADISIGPKRNEVIRRDVEFYEWHFSTGDKKKKLILTKDSLIISYDVYSSFEELIEDFNPIAGFMFNRFQNLQSKRLGLRYLNHITANGGNPLDWEEFINPEVLYPLGNLPDHENVIRELSKIDFKYDNYSLRFSLGIHNQDFPATIRERIFILDLDAYSEEVIEGGDVGELLVGFHAKIQEFFEFSITENLKGRMNDGNR